MVHCPSGSLSLGSVHTTIVRLVGQRQALKLSPDAQVGSGKLDVSIADSVGFGMDWQDGRDRQVWARGFCFPACRLAIKFDQAVCPISAGIHPHSLCFRRA